MNLYMRTVTAGNRACWSERRLNRSSRGCRRRADKAKRVGLGSLADRYEAKAAVHTTAYSAQSDASLHSDGPFSDFCLSAESHNLIPVYRRIMSDQITPVMAYKRLVKDNRDAPSFLFESVQDATKTGRFSFVGAWPDMEILGKGSKVTVLNHLKGTRIESQEEDPLNVAVDISRQWNPAAVDGLPDVFTGGWVGYVGYDTVRYTYPTKIPFETAPPDDRGLLDMHLALYKDMAVFDSATKLIYIISWVQTQPGDDLQSLYLAARARLTAMEQTLSNPAVNLSKGGAVKMDLSAPPVSHNRCNMRKQDFLAAVEATKEHIRAGDVFQLVLSQRFERSTGASPIDIYRALRIVNPSPYMVYLQARSCTLVASSPEILCRVDKDRVVTNRPLAGTRRRGSTAEEDAALEEDLLADEKECSEHIMLVDLGRNDVGRVATAGTVRVTKLKQIERYSHVMHISSTVKGQLREDLDAWDALRAALPVGTISGAPKVRAMQIIDELEVNRRGPYGGGFGHVSFTGTMDIALALRTMVIPTDPTEALYRYGDRFNPDHSHSGAERQWEVHLQAGAGLVADSDPESEYEETVNKANALSRAIDLAEHVFMNEESS